MRPVTLTVGPLVSAATNNICTSQTPSAGKALVLNGTLVTKSFQGTGSIAGNVLTVSAVSSGILQKGNLVSGSGVLPRTFVMGPLGTTTNGAGTYVVSASQSVSSTTIYGAAVATLDTPRRILLTPAADESANTFTITGTGWNGDPITEVLAGGNATATYTNLDFSTITQIVATNTAGGAVTVGTNGVASSRWLRFDDYSPAPNAIQVSVSGTVNYTIEDNLQTESSVSGGLSALTWVGVGIVGGSASTITPFAYTPMRLRVTLNSGSGSIIATVLQNASVTL
jgi:hypothetical protein